MISSINIDCRHIHSADDFYTQFIAQAAIDGEFGYNLDALWDWLTGALPLPALIKIHHITGHHSDGNMLTIIAVIVAAADQLNGQLTLIINGQSTLPEWLAEAIHH